MCLPRRPATPRWRQTPDQVAPSRRAVAARSAPRTPAAATSAATVARPDKPYARPAGSSCDLPQRLGALRSRFETASGVAQINIVQRGRGHPYRGHGEPARIERMQRSEERRGGEEGGGCGEDEHAPTQERV